jgi:hypothetical protein
MNKENIFKDELLIYLKELLENHIEIDDIKSLMSISFKEIGLQSMAIVGIFLELEMDGWIDISLIDNDFPPDTIEDIIKLAELFKIKKH